MNNNTTTEKLIEVKFNKKVWKETRIKIIEKTMLFITLTAFVFLMFSIIAMVEQWSVSGAPLVVALICIAWIILFFLYLFIVEIVL